MILQCKKCRHSLLLKEKPNKIKCGWQKGEFDINSKCNLQEDWNPYRNPHNDKGTPVDFLEPLTIMQNGKSIGTCYASFELFNGHNATKDSIFAIDWEKLMLDFKNFSRRKRNG